MQEVFISYKSEEASKAYAIKSVLEKNNISCWMAPESIPDGSDYTHEIPVAIRNCKVFLVLISKISQTSIWVKNEVDTAVNSNKVVIPYMLEECELTDEFNFLLTGRQRVDAYHKKEEKLRRLVKRIQIELAAENDVDSVGMNTNINANDTNKYSKTIVAIAISLLILVPLFVVGIVHLLYSKTQNFEIESFYILAESEQQYYYEKFIFSGKSESPIVNIYIYNSTTPEEEKIFLTRVEVQDGTFRFETNGEIWWCNCNTIEVVPCDNSGVEILQSAKSQELRINYPEKYGPIKILGAPYYISKKENLLISWKDESVDADTSTYHLQIIDASAWAKQSWDTTYIYVRNIDEPGYLLNEYSLEAGEYVIVVWSSSKGADYAYLTVSD